MKEMIIIADAVNDKINRIVKKIEKTNGIHEASYFIEILKSLKVRDVRINTDNEIYVTFMDMEIMRFTIERDVIK